MNRLIIVISICSLPAFAQGRTVVVGGNEGESSTFDTLSSALAVLDRSDGEADVIRVRTAAVTEENSLKIEFRDEQNDALTIVGDGPDGQAPTLIFSADIERYAIEVCLDSNAHFTLKNFSLIPAFSGSEVADFPHGAILVTDRSDGQPPVRSLSGVRVELENVVVTSSRPGNEPADTLQRIYKYEEHTRWSGGVDSNDAAFRFDIVAEESNDCQVRMIECRSAHTHCTGLDLDCPRGMQVTLQRCSTNYGGQSGILAATRDELVLTQCESRWNDGCGMLIDEGDGSFQAVDCWFTNNRKHGLQIGVERGLIPKRISILGGGYAENGHTDYRFAVTHDCGMLLWGGSPTVLEIAGTETAPVLFVRNGARGIRIDNPHAQIARIEYAVFTGRHRFEGLNIQNVDLSNSPVISRCVFAGNALESGLRSQLSIGDSNTNPVTLSIRDCTFYNAVGEGFSHVAVDSLGDTETHNLTLDIQRCIFAGGPANQGSDEIALYLDGVDCTAKFTDCALVAEGRNAISPDFARSNLASSGNQVVIRNCIRTNPSFVPSSYSGLKPESMAATAAFFRPTSVTYQSRHTPGGVDVGGYSSHIGATQSSAPPIRVAIYSDSGPDLIDICQTERVLNSSTEFSFSRIRAADIWSGRLEEFDVIMFPGGSAQAESRSLKSKGRRLVVDFVSNGGGYVGTCAGCYLATESTQSNYLGFCSADRIDTKNWRRGHGFVKLRLTSRGRELFGVDLDGDEIEYWQGPLLAPRSPMNDRKYIPLAAFASEIHDNGVAAGTMNGTDAFVVGEFGTGRYVGISPHPEGVTSTLFRCEYLIRLVKWASGNVRKSSALENEFLGVIKCVDLLKGVIVVEGTAAGETRSFKLSPESHVLIAGELATLAMLEVGSRVSVGYDSSTGKANLVFSDQALPQGPSTNGTDAQIPESELVTYQRGELPIIVSAPHGGREPILGVPRRKKTWLHRFSDDTDTRTYELAELVADNLNEQLGQKPWFIGARFHRRYLDANRRTEMGLEHESARPHYDTYHASIQDAIRQVNRQWGRGLLIDLHGQKLRPHVVWRGTRQGRTIGGLLARFGDDAVEGPQSIFGVLRSQGYLTHPTSISDDEAPYGGGFTVASYGWPYGIDAMLCEVGLELRLGHSVLEKTAADLTNAIAVFHDEYLPKSAIRP